MPLKKGKSQATISKNIHMLVKEGYPDGHGQAGAIAYTQARKHGYKAKRGKSNPILQGIPNCPIGESPGGATPTGMPFLRK